MTDKHVTETLTDYISGLLDDHQAAPTTTEQAVQDTPACEAATQHELSHKTPSPQLNTSEQQAQSVKAQAEPLKEANTTTPTAHPQQHKQRLEKMLQQVIALDGQSESKTLAKAALAETVIEPLTTTPNSTAVDRQQQDDMTAAALVEAESLPPLSSEWLDNGRPHWAQDRFDILLIEVNGLQLAVPLVALGQIQPIEEGLTPLFGQSDWFMGLQKTALGHVKTVNTAKFVMPERYQHDHDYKYVVSISGLSWGLAVDAIHQPISLDPDAIRWRGKRSSRPWMAGMVKDHMCVLLDIPSMGEILQKQDKNHA